MKRVRNLQIYLTAMSLLLSGCSLDLKSANLDSEDSTCKQEETNSFGFNNSSNSVYFNRTYNSSADYDDMILTLEEKGVRDLSDEAKSAVQNVSLYNAIPYDFSWVEYFRIDDYYQSAYTHPNITSRIRNHHNTELYNRISNSIYWEKLADYIINNTEARIQKDDTNELVALSTSDVKTIVKQLSEFVNDVKRDYPDYDMEHLACQLQLLSLAYRVDDNDSRTLASTSYASIEWYLNDDGKYPILKTSLMLNNHEFKHFLCSYCRDEITTGENVYVTPSGLIYGANTALNFSFIEEATAEEYSANRNGQEEVTYYEKIAALDTIRFVLSMQDDYEDDAFLKYSFLQNPLATVQQFPVLNSQTYYFKNNLKMLAAYNACLSSLPYVFVSSVESVPGYQGFYENLEQRKEVLSSLGTYASVELSRLFMTNLVVMNDTKDSMTLGYNFYLIRLFEKRMDIMFSAISDFQKFNMSSANYKQIYQERLGALFQYLGAKYKIDLGAIRELYEEYYLNQETSYPAFVDESRKAFYQELEKTEYNGQQLKEDSETHMQYYVQYSGR